MTNKLTKKDINKVYVRNLFGYQWGWNYKKNERTWLRLGDDACIKATIQ